MSRRNWSKDMEPHLDDGTRARGDKWAARYEDDDGVSYRVRGEGVYSYPKITVVCSDGNEYLFDMNTAVTQREWIAADVGRFRAFIAAVNGWGGELEWLTKADQNDAKPLPSITRYKDNEQG